MVSCFHGVLVVWCMSLVRTVSYSVMSTTGGGVMLSLVGYMVSLLMLLAVVQDTDACIHLVSQAFSLVTLVLRIDAFPRTH